MDNSLLAVRGINHKYIVAGKRCFIIQACNMVQAGYGETGTTSDNSSEMVGFYRPDNCFRDMRDSLRFQVLVWEVDGVMGGLIIIDSLDFTVELPDVLRDRTAAAFHMGREWTMICSSHAYSTPNAVKEPDYFEMVCWQAGTAARKAAGRTKSMEAAWGTGENTVGMDRRNEPEQMDGRLSILKLAARDGKGPEVLLIRVIAHANILSGDNYFISADYTGVARKWLEKACGYPMMMVQGVTGDVHSRHHQDNMEYVEIHCWETTRGGFSQKYRQKYVPQSRRTLEQMAEDMFRSVDAMYVSLVLTPLGRMEIRSSFCRLTADTPDMERAEEIAEEAEREGEVDGRIWSKKVKRLLDEGIRKRYANIEIRYLFVNQGCLCGVPNETMYRITIDIQKEVKVPLLFFNGYTSKCSNYLPTAEEYDKGGYEVLRSDLVYLPYHSQVMSSNRDMTGRAAAQVVEDQRKSRS